MFGRTACCTCLLVNLALLPVAGAAELVTAVNLNGPALVIDGHPWQAGDHNSLHVVRGKGFANQNVPLVPATDEHRAAMLRSSIYDPDRSAELRFEHLASQTHTLLLYIWEDNNSETFDILLNGKPVERGVKSGSAGSWQRLGPWQVEPVDGKITLAARGGHANLSGVELWRGVYSGLSAEQEEFFEKRIRPVLVGTCGKCHGPEKSNGGLRLDRASFVAKGGESGPVIHPGKPDNSLLVDAIRRTENEVSPMPPEKPLPATAVADLVKWVAMGAPWPATDTRRILLDRPKPKTDHWSFQPLGHAQPPASKTAAAPIDRFLAAAQQQHQLRPLPRAARQTLIRRATYDLTGLPPTPAEVAAFVADDAPDAFARLVERLLASPHYGEKWGRHWLDLVRYADTAGDNSDYPIPQAYLYRDYVIRAFNEDKPYDQLLREQVAGDLMPSTSSAEHDQRIIATGYIAESRRFGSVIENYPQHLTIGDTLENLGRTVLGLTLGCARCHNHKFDPISQADYYALYGILESTRYAFPGIELDKKPRDFVKLASFSGNQVAYAVSEGHAANARIHVAGNPENLGDEVPRGFLAVLGGQTLPDSAKQSGRLELAGWLTDPKNPLTARVMVNRIWQHHFGKGLVQTPSDFGTRGMPPTHPELLDWLARQFIDSGWSIKQMHRLIMNTAAYQQASAAEPSADLAGNLERDPANEYLWRFPRRRLTAEEVRDTLLLLAGHLNLDPPAGPHPFPPADKWKYTQHHPFADWYDSDHRTVYLMTKRLRRHPLYAVFDGPDQNATTPVRTSATTTVQALYLLNDEFLHQQAAALAGRLQPLPLEDRIGRAFQLTLARPPADWERARSREFFGSDQSNPAVTESFVRALLRANEFLYLD